MRLKAALRHLRQDRKTMQAVKTTPIKIRKRKPLGTVKHLHQQTNVLSER